MHQKKIEYLLWTNRRIRNAIVALEGSVGSKLKQTFSEMHHVFNSLNAADDIEGTVRDGGFNCSGITYMLEPDFRFSDNPKVFWIEFQAVTLLFADKGLRGDVRVEVLVMEALVNAGMLLEALVGEGHRKSDWPKEMGSKQHKGHITHEEVIQEAKDVVERLKGLGIKPMKERVMRDVRKRLLKSEREKENPREVYKMDHIKKNILKDVWSDIL